MRCLVLLPVVFCSLAQAQGSIAATLYSRTGDTINISRDRCINLQRNQPRFYQINVRKSNVCLLYRDLNCIGGDGHHQTPTSPLNGGATNGAGPDKVDSGVFAQPDFSFEPMDMLDWLL
ncbi:hypothetical protein MY3296_009331 [Beauveria thailandica]